MEDVMLLFESLPKNPHLADVFKAFPRGTQPLLEFHDIVLRGESALSIGERELIAAYVSGLNNCSFCFGSHAKTAMEFGIEANIFESLLEDIETTNISENFKPVLKYVQKLTLTPSQIIQSDIDSILQVGYDDRAIYDIATICALFNFMNRIVEGMGVVSSSSIMKKENPKRDNKTSYQDFGRSIGVLS